MNKHRIILDLCGGTGTWSKPYKEAGYDVRNITLPDHDVRTYKPPQNVYGILAAPPCTHLSGSGARWWEKKGREALFEALAIVDSCMWIILISNPIFWCLENPVGRLIHYLGKPEMYFQPYEYGDPWSKKTCLWGEFIQPKKSPVPPTQKDKIWKLPPSENRAMLRSITPPGFARAFFEANR